MPAKLFVGNLSFQATEEDLRELFQQAGTVESVRIVTDQFTGRPRGFGFVEMATKEESAKAIEMLNGRLFRDRNLVVDEARPQPQRGGAAAAARAAVAVVDRVAADRAAAAEAAGAARRRRPRGETPGAFSRITTYSSGDDMMNRPGVPAPGFVKRIGSIIDQRRSVEFRPLESRRAREPAQGSAVCPSDGPSIPSVAASSAAGTAMRDRPMDTSVMPIRSSSRGGST